MPQCQRTGMILDDRFRLNERCLRCPGWKSSPCIGGETYCDISSEVWAEVPVRLAMDDAHQEFGRTSWGVRLWDGLYPQTIREREATEVDVYLHADARDAERLAFQASHEVVHVICNPGTIHWTHEVVATLFSMDHLVRSGFSAYRERSESYLQREVLLLSTEQLMAWTPERRNAPGVHGRAYVVGRQLVEIVGWSAVRDLSLYPRLSVDEWVDSLTAHRRDPVRKVLLMRHEDLEQDA